MDINATTHSLAGLQVSALATKSSNAIRVASALIRSHPMPLEDVGKKKRSKGEEEEEGGKAVDD